MPPTHTTAFGRLVFTKKPSTAPSFASRHHLIGDGQADLKNHGGPDKAICAYSADHAAHWQTALGLALPAGAFGENFTTLGVVESDLCIGDVFRVGDVVLQISQPRQPCWKLARRWRIRDLAAQVEQTGRTGWYFRVLTEGDITAPADFARLERPHPEWTVAAANDIMHHRKNDLAAARALADCPALSESWRSALARRSAQN